MKLQPGDYVSTEGMTEEEYHAVCRAFIEAGATKGEAYDPDYFRERVSPYLGWNSMHGVFLSSEFSRGAGRELTKDQILGAQKNGYQ